MKSLSITSTRAVVGGSLIGDLAGQAVGALVDQQLPGLGLGRKVAPKVSRAIDNSASGSQTTRPAGK